MSDINLIVEKYLTAIKDYGSIVEIFVNPTKKEMRDDVGDIFRFIADAKNKKVFMFSQHTLHSRAWANAISKETNDNRRLYFDPDLFAGVVEGNKVYNWGVQDKMFTREVLEEWMTHPDMFDWAKKWVNISEWMKRNRKDVMDDIKSGRNLGL
jgi:hypothetical protein